MVGQANEFVAFAFDLLDQPEPLESDYMSKNSELARHLDELDRATGRALRFFERIDKLGAFPVGALDGALTHRDPNVERVQRYVVGAVQALPPELLGTSDTDGLPLDFEEQVHDPSGVLHSTGIGLRGRTFAAALGGFLSSLEREDAQGCVEGIKRIRTLMEEVRADITEESGNRGDPQEAPPVEQGPSPIDDRPTQESRDAKRAEDGGPAMVREPAGWRITFEGRTYTYPDLKGFRIVARLLEKPNRDFGCIELDHRQDDSAAQPLMDEKALRALKVEIEDAEAVGNEKVAHQLREELHRVAGLGGRVREMGSPKEQARKNVGKAITKALGHIKDHQKDLHQHLLRSVQTPSGLLVSYRPPDGTPTWFVTGI